MSAAGIELSPLHENGLNRIRSNVIIRAANRKLRRRNMERLLLLFMITAVGCALFSDRIDMAVKGNKKVKKVIVIFSVGVLLVCTIAIFVSLLS